MKRTSLQTKVSKFMPKRFYEIESTAYPCEGELWTLTDSYKHSSLFSISVNDDKKFYNIDTLNKCYKTFCL